MVDAATDKNRTIKRVYIWISIIALLAEIIVLATGNLAKSFAGIPLFTMFFAMALYARKTMVLKGISFTFLVFAFIPFSMYYPYLIKNWGFDTRVLVVPSVQLIMFGMGTKLSVGDFLNVFRKPKGVLIGTFLVYTIMPVTGLLLIKSYGFTPEVSAGIILIGSCPGGMASNVMTFLANGNVALSVSITALATLLAPFITPFLMESFAGRLIEIKFLTMMISILKMVILPIVAGLIVNKLLRGREKWRDRILPPMAMGAILLYIVIVTAHYRNELLVVGLALIGASIIHNFIGFIFGYWLGKLAGLSETDCRTLSIEVGLKNGGMGVGLAINVLKSGEASLASLIFGSWMNISGSTLANYWRQKPVQDKTQQEG